MYFDSRRKPRGHARRDPPLAVAGLSELREHVEQHRRRCDLRRIGRRHQHLHADHRHRVEDERRQRAGMLAFQKDRARTPDRNRGNDRQQQRNEPHTETRVAEDRRAGADDEGHQRRMVVIAPGKILRPLPVIGFVERERRHRGNDTAHDDQRGKKTAMIWVRRSSPEKLTSRATRTGWTSSSSTPRPSARRRGPRATRSADRRRARTPRRHWSERRPS